MQQRFYFEYAGNGNLSRTEFTDDKLYQGQQAAAEYFVKMAVATDTNNWLSSDTVFINFTRPDSKTASVRMTYDSEFGGWKLTTNGWETDVDISTSSDLTVSFVARRYSTVDAALLVKSMTSESVVLTIYPTAGFTPLNLTTGEIDTITNELADHETRISDNETDIGTLQTDVSNKINKLTTTGQFVYTHNGSTQGEIGIGATANLIPQRDSTAQIAVPYVPTANEHAASKLYVDSTASGAVTEANVYADGVAATAESNANDYAGETFIPLTYMGAANGVAPLGSDSKISSTYLPSYVDDIIEVANYDALPTEGESGKIYVTLDTNLTYRWSGTAYVEISQSLALGETELTAYRGDRGKMAYDGVNTLTPFVSSHTTKLSYVSTGGPGAIYSNFNIITVNGFYTGYGTAIGAPSVSYSWFILHQNSNVNNNSATQKAIAYSTDLIQYERIKQGDTWGAWKNVSPFIWAEGEATLEMSLTIPPVTTYRFTADCNANTHYKLTNSQDVILTILNAYNGYYFEIEMHGGYALTLPANYKTDASFAYTTVLDNTQYYVYGFSYDGTNWRVIRNVYDE